MNEEIRQRIEKANLVEDTQNPLDRRVIINFNTDQLRRVGVQVADHFMRGDKDGAWHLMQTYNLSSQGHYQLMAFAMQRMIARGGNTDILFIDWLAGIHYQ